MHLRSFSFLATFLALFCALLFVRFYCARSLHRQVVAAAAADAALPKEILWVWERPETLRGLQTSQTGIAVLEETLRLGASVVAIPRQQPFVAPFGIAKIAVVRLEPEAVFASHHEDATMRNVAVRDLLRVVRQPGVDALQVEFDATRSQRSFYRQLLIDLRRRMPAGLPLEITALASWCSTDDWIGNLPVNSAVPMFFRMEPDRRRILADESAYRIREPLCLGSVGVSTREAWPRDTVNKRVYVFADRGWKNDLALLHPAKMAPFKPKDEALP